MVPKTGALWSAGACSRFPAGGTGMGLRSIRTTDTCARPTLNFEPETSNSLSAKPVQTGKNRHPVHAGRARCLYRAAKNRQRPLTIVKMSKNNGKSPRRAQTLSRKVLGLLEAVASHHALDPKRTAPMHVFFHTQFVCQAGRRRDDFATSVKAGKFPGHAPALAIDFATCEEIVS